MPDSTSSDRAAHAEPVAESAASRPATAGKGVTWKRLTADQRKGCRVLLAEDDVVSQRIAMFILQKMDFQVTAVSDGRQTLEALRTGTFDIVLLDIQMPDMNGIEVAEYIRNPTSDVQQHAVPVVALTASAMASDRDQCLHAGMNAHVAKPLSPQALADAIEQCLEVREAGQTRLPGLKIIVGPGLAE